MATQKKQSKPKNKAIDLVNSIANSGNLLSGIMNNMQLTNIGKHLERIANCLEGNKKMSEDLAVFFKQEYIKHTYKNRREGGKMKVVYIAHPISGDIDNNVKKILAIIADINKNYPDVVPFAPYLTDVMAIDETLPGIRERCINNDKELFSRNIIDELWLYGNKISEGMKAEIEAAKPTFIDIVAMTPETKAQAKKEKLF